MKYAILYEYWKRAWQYRRWWRRLATRCPTITRLRHVGVLVEAKEMAVQVNDYIKRRRLTPPASRIWLVIVVTLSSPVEDRATRWRHQRDFPRLRL